jgi:hypothetical protein
VEVEVERGKGIPEEEREVIRRREVCEWEGCVCAEKLVRLFFYFQQ